MAMLRKIVESFFGNPVMHLHREDRLKSKRNTTNQSGGVFLRVLSEGFFTELVVPRETQAPLWGRLAARSGEMPNHDCDCRRAVENPNALWEPTSLSGSGLWAISKVLVSTAEHLWRWGWRFHSESDLRLFAPLYRDSYRSLWTGASSSMNAKNHRQSGDVRSGVVLRPTRRRSGGYKFCTLRAAGRT